MAKPKLVLAASPTFKARVMIPIPGAHPVPVEFVFKHRSADEYREWAGSLNGGDESEMIMGVVSGWDLDDAFNQENVEALLNSYMGSGKAIFDKYISENTGAKAGN